MENSEVKARKYLKKLHPKGYIKKMPDFKITGMLKGGMPDYLVIEKGKTIWYEIKTLDQKKKSFPASSFTNQQMIEFRLMYKAKANIKILLYHGKNYYLFNWSLIYNHFINNNKSIKINMLR